MRRHQVIFDTLAYVCPDRRVPFDGLDILYFCFASLSEPSTTPTELALAFTYDELRYVFEDTVVTRWLDGCGVELDSPE